MSSKPAGWGLLPLAVIASSAVATRPVRAEPGPWSSDTALTMPQGRWEAGLFHGLHWGAQPDLQLSLHPVLFFALPHVEGKVRWYSRGPLHLGTRHRLSYPTVFLDLVSREGALGLLPANTEAPIVIQFDNDVLGSWEFVDGQVATLEGGITTAPRLTSGEDLPLLDFPFLYNRFAATKTTFTAYAGLGVEGQFLEVLAYQLDFDLYWLRVIPGAYTVEQGTSLSWRPSAHFALLVGCRLSYGRYPVGERFHYLPFFDVLVGF